MSESVDKMRTFVLVHGAWHGGWCWRRVADLLSRQGHRVYTPTLTGLGERSLLLNASIDLSTHIADVVNVFKWEDIADATLCGHSYGGWVISGVVEQVEAQVSSIVFLDAHLPYDGEKGIDSSHHRKEIFLAIELGEMSTQPPHAEYFGVNLDDREWVNSKLTPQPIGVSLQSIHLTGARERIAKRTYIRATSFPSATFDRCLKYVESSPGWNVYRVACGHDVMIDEPARLAQILLEVT